MSTDQRKPLGTDHSVPMDSKHGEPVGIGNRDPIETGNTVPGPRPGEETQKVFGEAMKLKSSVEGARRSIGAHRSNEVQNTGVIGSCTNVR